MIRFVLLCTAAALLGQTAHADTRKLVITDYGLFDQYKGEEIEVTANRDGTYKVWLNPYGDGNSFSVQVRALDLASIRTAVDAEMSRKNFSDRRRGNTRQLLEKLESSTAVAPFFASYTTGTEARTTERLVRPDLRAAQRTANDPRTASRIRELESLVTRFCEGQNKNQALCDRYSKELAEKTGQQESAQTDARIFGEAIESARVEAAAADAELGFASARVENIRKNVYCCPDIQGADGATRQKMAKHCEGATGLNTFFAKDMFAATGMNEQQAKWACNGVEKMCFGSARCAYIKGDTVIPFEGNVACGFGADGDCSKNVTACLRQNEGGIQEGLALDSLRGAGFNPSQPASGAPGAR
jgi:hypothetical protein